jgi:hypothetical protein
MSSARAKRRLPPRNSWIASPRTYTVVAAWERRERLSPLARVAEHAGARAVGMTQLVARKDLSPEVHQAWRDGQQRIKSTLLRPISPSLVRLHPEPTASLAHDPTTV